jgi:uncharacterized damage-inducible protein DinB
MQDAESNLDPSTEILIAENIKALRDAQKLLEQLDDHTFVQVQSPTFSGSFGSQLRHCLDFYQCFLRGLKAGKIDYDSRERDAATEQDRRRAGQRIEQITERLWKLTDDQATLWVKQDSPYWSTSSLRRELQFLLSHLVHHQALLAVMLRVYGFVPCEDLGIAPSTLEHWKERSVLDKLVARRPRLSVVL